MSYVGRTDARSGRSEVMEFRRPSSRAVVLVDCWWAVLVQLGWSSTSVIEGRLANRRQTVRDTVGNYRSHVLSETRMNVRSLEMQIGADSFYVFL